MKPRYLLSVIASFTLSCASYASIVPYHIDPSTQQILDKVQYKKMNRPNLPNEVVVKLDEIKQQQMKVINELKTNIEKLNLKDDVKNSLKIKMNKSIKNRLAINHDSSSNDNTNTEINFLELRLEDGIYMLIGVKTAAMQTFSVMQEMSKLASEAARGTHSATELANLNALFQSYINALNYIQTIDILNGEKNLSNGNISIRIGEDNDPSSNLTIKLLPFDPKSLSLTTLDIATSQNAQNALNILQESTRQLNQNIVVLNSPVLTDALTLLISIPTVLNQDYTLFINILEVILSAINGTNNDDDRIILDFCFNYFKNAINKTQTYVSLDGVKMLGKGNIHIQIGNYTSDATTLNIDLPVTDISKLGLDNLDVKTQAAAYDALNAILKDLHDFAYTPTVN